MAPENRPEDRRVQKTRSLLHEALATLIREKDYDSIVVKEILDRANVGRSTFYTHFRDKDALLAGSIHNVLRSVRPPARRSSPPGRPYEGIIWFSLPIFEHLDRHRHTGQARNGTRGRAVIHERLQKVLAELIAGDVRKLAGSRRKTAGGVPPDVLVQYVASTFVLVLNWWVEGSPLSAREANDLFRALILPTLAAACR